MRWFLFNRTQSCGGNGNGSASSGPAYLKASVVAERDRPSPVAEIVRDGKSLAAAGGADVILSTSNSTGSMVDSIQGLRPDRRLVAMGADAEPLSISLMDLIMKRIRVIGSQQNGPEYLYEALDFRSARKS